MDNTNSSENQQRRIEDHTPAATIDWSKPGAPAVPLAAAEPREPARPAYVASMLVNSDGVSVYPTPAANELPHGHYVLSTGTPPAKAVSVLARGLSDDEILQIAAANDIHVRLGVVRFGRALLAAAAQPTAAGQSAEIVTPAATSGDAPADSRDMLIAEAVRNECLSAAHEADPQHEIRRIDLKAVIARFECSTPTDLQQLKALALAATPGPWTATHWSGHAPTTVMLSGTTMAIAETTGFGRDSSECAPDAAFIAAANPAVVLDLIARIGTLEDGFKLALGALALRDYEEADRIGKQYRQQVARIERAAAPKRPMSPEIKAAIEEAHRTGATSALATTGEAVFINYGHDLGDNAHLECTACGGSGHIEDQKAIAATASGDELPTAWAHEDGRVVSASTKATAERDGGAMRSSLSGYTIPLYPRAAVSAATKPTTETRCNWPSCQPEEVQQQVAAQAHAELYTGAATKPTADLSGICGACNGSGWVNAGCVAPCNQCGGQGGVTPAFAPNVSELEADILSVSTALDSGAAQVAFSRIVSRLSLLATKPAAAPAVPEGWKLVPVEPTGVMKDAGAFSGMPAGYAHPWLAADVYRAMIRNAPAAPSATPAAQDQAKAEGGAE